MYWVPKGAVRVGTTFFEEKIHRGIRDQNLENDNKFQVWVVLRFFSKGQKTTWGGVHRPQWIKGLSPFVNKNNSNDV